MFIQLVDLKLFHCVSLLSCLNYLTRFPPNLDFINIIQAPINLFEFAAIPFPVQVPPKGRPLLNRSVSL